MSPELEPLDITSMALALADATARFRRLARQFFYEVMLADHECPTCGGRLHMIGESRCRCEACGLGLDPTREFQRCGRCGGQPVLRISRYQCRDCGADLPSRFVFDGIVFDADYFRQKMVETRDRKKACRAEAARRAAETRSGRIEMPVFDWPSVPGLRDALNDLVGCAQPQAWMRGRRAFDLERYERHLQAHIGRIAVSFERIPVLADDRRLDRIWRFIAMIFLFHDGLIDVRQNGEMIMVRHVDAD